MLKINRLILIPLFLLLLPILATASMWEVHDEQDARAVSIAEITFTGDDAYYVNLIKGREKIFDGCNAGADALVAGYFKTNTRKDYQQAHKKLSYESCWTHAGTDDDLKVCCLGIGAHQTQDPYSHGYDDTIVGYTEICVNNYWGTNFLTHIACENAYLKWMLSDMPEYEKEQLILNAGNTYDIFYTNGKIEGNKYADLIAKSIGFTSNEQKENFYNALSTVGYFIKQGQGSGYVNMYKSNAKIPSEYYIYILSGLIIGILLMFISFRFGQNNLKWVLFGIGALFFILAIWFGIALLTGKAFNWYRNFSDFTPTIIYSSLAGFSILSIFVSLTFNKRLKIATITIFSIIALFAGYVLLTTHFGYVTIQDPESYMTKAVEATVTFLKTGQLANVDASGLDFCTGNNCYTGTLWLAGNKFNVVQYLFLGAIFYLLTVIIIQMRKSNVKKG